MKNADEERNVWSHQENRRISGGYRLPNLAFIGKTAVLLVLIFSLNYLTELEPRGSSSDLSLRASNYI